MTLGGARISGFEGLAIETAVVPLPPAAWMGLGVLGLLGVATRRRRS